MSLLRFAVIEVDAPPTISASWIPIHICIRIRWDVLPIQDELVGGGWRQRGLQCQRCVTAGTTTTDIWRGVNAVSTLPYPPRSASMTGIWRWVLINADYTTWFKKYCKYWQSGGFKSSVNALSTLDKHLFLSLTGFIGRGTPNDWGHLTLIKPNAKANR